MGANHGWRNAEPPFNSFACDWQCACMTLHLYTSRLWAFCVPFCLCWIACACIVATSKAVTVYSLQLSAVVLLLMLLQMVNEISLVQLLGPQWPTPVPKGTTCKETAYEPAWPIDSGVGGRLLAIVSFSLFYFYFYMGIKSPLGQGYFSVMTVGGSPGFYRHRANKQQVEWLYTCSAWLRSNYAQCVQSIVTYNVTYTCVGPQWPTSVTQGTQCKGTVDVLAWPMDSEVGGHQLAVVSCFAIRCSTIDNTWTAKVHQSNILLQCAGSGIILVHW